MKFEFDENKSQSNLDKHGIDFIEAQTIWHDFDRVEFLLDTQDEERFLVIGKTRQKVWSAIITYRGNAVRIISVRRARKKEILDYEEQ